MTDVSGWRSPSGTHGPGDGDSGSGALRPDRRLSDESASGSDESDVMALELDNLITEYFDAHREGRAPSVDDYVADHPEHEHALRAVLPGASLLDQMGKRAEDASPSARSGDKLGEYKLLGVLGRGGMGVVYEAVQETLGRPVALKVLPASRVVDRQSRERFMREAQAAASLQHPGIVPVYGVGEAEGQVYYAMQRVDGVPLDVLSAVVRGESASGESSVLMERALGVVARLKGEASGSGFVSPLPDGSRTDHSTSDSSVSRSDANHVVSKPWIANAVRIAQQIAEALSYAHSRGVLHRDVKPSNVMLDESGRAYVTDFGLCKVEDSSSLTAAGDVVGTLRYVPPERFQGRDDARGDVYGVGMILYELLCGRAAFDQKERATLVQAVTLHAPPRPRKVNPEIPEDLERIVLAATSKLPEERYVSAEALIADLSAFLGGRPIAARAPGKLYLAKLFARRNRGLVMTVAASAVLLAILTVVYVRDLGNLLQEVEAGRTRAERMFYHAQVHAAAEAARNNNGGSARALRILDGVEPELRDWVWSTMQARCEVGFLTVDAGSPSIRWMVSDTSEDYVGVLRSSSVRVHNAMTGDLIFEAPCESGLDLAFLPGSLDLVVVERGKAGPRLIRQDPTAPSPWASALETAFAEVEAADDSAALAVDSDGVRLSCVWDSGRLEIYSMEDDGAGSQGLGLAEFQVPTGEKVLLSLYGKDGRAAYAVHGRALRALGPASGRIRRVRGGDARVVTVLAGARDADYFVAQGASKIAVRYHDRDEPTIGHADETIRESATISLAISPDGEEVIAQFLKGKFRFWCKARGPSMSRVASYLAEPSSIVWPRGGNVVLTGGQSGDWRVVPRPGYDVGTPGASEIRGHYSDVHSLALDSQGQFLATAETTGAWSVWNVARHMPRAAEVRSTRIIRHAALSSVEGDPDVLAVAGDEVGLWQISEMALQPHRYTKVADEADACGIAWLREDGSEPLADLLIAKADGRVLLARDRSEGDWTTQELWAADATLTSFFHHRGAGFSVVGADDGRVWKLALAADGSLDSATLIAEFPNGVTAVAIGTLAEAVAVQTSAEILHLVDLNARDAKVRWSVNSSSYGVQARSASVLAVDEASEWVVTAGADGALQLWSMIEGLPGPLLETRYGTFTGLAFPEPNTAPISLEERGRVTLIETEGIGRMRELADIEPTDDETYLFMCIAPRVRLAEIEKIIKREAVTERDLQACRSIAKGLMKLSRFYSHVSPEEAKDMLDRVEERLAALDGE